MPTSLLGEIAREPDGKFNQSVAEALENTSKIVLSGVGHTWVINTPDVPNATNTIVLYSGDRDSPPDLHTIIDQERDATAIETMFREGTEWAHLNDALTEVDHLMKDGATRQGPPEPEESLLTQQHPLSLTRKRKHGKTDCFVTTRSGKQSDPQVHEIGVEDEVPSDGQSGTLTKRSVVASAGTPAPTPVADWVGKQPEPQALDQLMLVKTPGGYTKNLKIYRDNKGHVRISVPKAQRISLTL